MGRADTHVHTEYSGFSNLGAMKFPESVTSPEQQVDNARRKGFDVLAITDHDETTGAFIAERYSRRFDDIEVIPGEEITTADGEIIGLFLNERIRPGLPVEETVDIIRSQGGLTIAPHPFSFHVFALREKIFGLDLDGFETINGGHPDPYSNRFARMVMDRYPGRWAELSSSDAHSVFTSGYNWTEFDGTTAEDFRRSVLSRTTRACGAPAPVFTQVQWSVDVVIGGQKLLYKSLVGNLKNTKDDHLIEKINSINNLKKATGILAGSMYLTPPVVFIATFLSTMFLNRRGRKLNATAESRLEEIDEIIRSIDAGKM
ncbi:MAG: PHP domain-containing protein [Candidatus Methanomethylophilaceae archaeon]|nr:PHP domain-containing protein [Candidatus Methanomethylophilaceae archaeon]